MFWLAAETISSWCSVCSNTTFLIKFTVNLVTLRDGLHMLVGDSFMQVFSYGISKTFETMRMSDSYVISKHQPVHMAS